MSRRTIARSSLNMNSARARASSVLPTPVGPRNTNEPIGRFGSCRPVRARRNALESLLLLRPRAGECVAHLFRLGDLALERVAHLLRLLRQGGQLDLQLADPPLGLVELDRRRVDLHAQARSCLVDEVDRLVG